MGISYRKESDGRESDDIFYSKDISVLTALLHLDNFLDFFLSTFFSIIIHSFFHLNRKFYIVTISEYIAHFTLAAFFKFLHDDIEGSNLVLSVCSKSGCRMGYIGRLSVENKY